LGSLDEVLE